MKAMKKTKAMALLMSIMMGLSLVPASSSMAYAEGEIPAAIEAAQGEIESTAATDSAAANEETTSVKVTMLWDDEDDKEGIRPSEITVMLLEDGEATGKALTINAEADWRGSFLDLPVSNSNDEAVVYTVQEISIEGYEESRLLGDPEYGYTFLNIHIPVAAEDLEPEASEPEDLAPAAFDSETAEDAAPAASTPAVAEDIEPAASTPAVAEDIAPAASAPVAAEDLEPEALNPEDLNAVKTETLTASSYPATAVDLTVLDNNHGGQSEQLIMTATGIAGNAAAPAASSAPRQSSESMLLLWAALFMAIAAGASVLLYRRRNA